MTSQDGQPWVTFIQIFCQNMLFYVLVSALVTEKMTMIIFKKKLDPRKN